MNRPYIGKQTALALENFPFSIHGVHKELLYAVCGIKKAAAIAHKKIGELDPSLCDAIVAACDEVLQGKFDDQFPLSALQGGAGTSLNMNVNEVIAERATEILQEKHKNNVIHPLDDVNKSQSTNDVNPSALKIASVRLSTKLLQDMEEVVGIFQQKASEWRNIPKLARTHLQDAVPITVGEESLSYATILQRDAKRIKDMLSYFYELNLGGTAVGNGINASPLFIKEVYQSLRSVTKLNFQPAANLMAQTSSLSDFCFLSQALVLLCLDASKIASDLRLLSSGPNGGIGELKLTELQAGSSIMPGKVNPVLPEVVNQLYFLVSGNNLTVEHAAHAGQLELDVMFPVLADRLIESLKLTDEVLLQFARVCVKNINVDKERCKKLLESSTAYATLLTPKLGYDIVSQAVKESVKTGRSIREIILLKKLLTAKRFDRIVRGDISQ